MAFKTSSKQKLSTSSAITSSIGTGGGGGGTGPVILSVYITDSSYTTLDDTAIATSGGYLKLLGTGFVTGCTIYVNGIAATTTTFVSSTEVRAAIPAFINGTYSLMLFNSSGSGAMWSSGLTFSGFPSITTTSYVNAGNVVNTQLIASGDGTLIYSLQGGSTLPAGVTLSSTGLISGTASSITVATVISFTVLVDDAQKQSIQQAITLSLTFGDVYFPSTVLLLNADTLVNNATNNTFLDSSVNNSIITRTGTPTQGTFSPFSPTGWGGHFNGTSDLISCAPSANFNFGTGNFTIESWINLPKLPTAGYYTVLSNYYGATLGAGYWTMEITFGASTNTTAIYYNGSVKFDGTNVAFKAGQWYHIALVRNGTTITFYVNGTASGSVTYAGQFGSSSDAFTIGCQPSPRGGYSNAYFSNVRVVKGTAVYTSNFVPSDIPLTAITNTSLLTLQSNRFVDSSINNAVLTVSGTTSIQAFSPFAPGASYNPTLHGGSSYFAAGVNYLTSASRTMSASAFTIEAWLNTTNKTIYACMMRNGTTEWNASDVWVAGLDSSGNKLWVYAGAAFTTGGTLSLTSTTTISDGAWHHMAFTYDGTNYRLFIDGKLEAYQTASAMTVASRVVCVGHDPRTVRPWLGYVSGARVVSGTVVYSTTSTTVGTSVFAIPTAPPTAITNTSLLLNFTNAGIQDATSRNNIVTVGDAKVSTTVKKYGTGSIYFDGTGDYLTIPKTPLLDFGTGDVTVELWYYITSTTAWNPIISKGPDDGDDEFFLTILSGGQYYFDYGNNSTEYVQGGTAVVNAWTHLALVKTGTTLKLYTNGILSVSGTLLRTLLTNNHNMYIGMGRNGTYHFNGYMDDIRITKYARYTANFTPPTQLLG